MATTAFDRDSERNIASSMATNGDKTEDGRKRVLVVGAGAAGYVSMGLA